MLNNQLSLVVFWSLLVYLVSTSLSNFFQSLQSRQPLLVSLISSVLFGLFQSVQFLIVSSCLFIPFNLFLFHVSSCLFRLFYSLRSLQSLQSILFFLSLLVSLISSSLFSLFNFFCSFWSLLVSALDSQDNLRKQQRKSLSELKHNV